MLAYQLHDGPMSFRSSESTTVLRIRANLVVGEDVTSKTVQNGVGIQRTTDFIHCRILL